MKCFFFYFLQCNNGFIRLDTISEVDNTIENFYSNENIPKSARSAGLVPATSHIHNKPIRPRSWHGHHDLALKPLAQSYTTKEAALVVHERVVIVNPRITIAKEEPQIKLSSETPTPSYNEAKELLELANNFQSLTNDFSQVTVTDADTQSQVELNFNTPSPSPPPDPVHKALKHIPDSQKPSGWITNRRSSVRTVDSAEIRSTSRKSSVCSLPERYEFSPGNIDDIIYEAEDDETGTFESGSEEELKSPTMRSKSPRKAAASPDRPSWGFGNSRVPSRQDVGHDHNDYGALYERSPSRNSRAPPRSLSRNERGLSYEDIIKSSGNTLKPTRRLSRQDSKISLASNVTSRWKEDLQNYQAMKITIYKNADQWFEGFELRFKPAKDFQSLDAMLAKISPKLTFTTSVSYLFDTDGNMIKKLDDLEDSQSYVASNTKKFFPANYGRVGDAFYLEGSRGRIMRSSFRKRSGSSKSSSSDSKPGSGDGKVIKIINNEDPSVSERVLLNLKTSQQFEEVVRDLGQVLKIQGADRMYNLSGREVKSFSHFRHEFFDETSFVITSGPAKIDRSIYKYTSLTRSNSAVSLRKSSTRPRSMSRTRDADSAGNFKILINGVRKIYHGPHRLPKENHSRPDHFMELEWVYGYRGANENDNLFVLPQGELAYYVGAVVVIYNRMEEVQRHYRGHTEDIQSMSLHPDGNIMASGQKSGNFKETLAHVRVWDTSSMDTLTVLGLGECENGINCINFSILNKGEYITAVDDSKEHILSVWEWANNDLTARVVTNVNKINGVSFHPFDNNLIITYGTSHLCFWSKKQDSFFERVDVAEKDSHNLTYQSLAFLESGDLVVGDNEGFVSSYSVTNEGEYFRSFKFSAHEKGISCITIMTEGTLVTAGERDRLVKAWDSNRDFEKIAESEISSSAGSAKTLCPQWPGKPDANLYVGTSKNVILEGSLQRKFNMIIFGHMNHLQALATHPMDVSFITAGIDKIVANWRRSKLIWKTQVQSDCISACYHPQGTVVAIGTSDGNMIILRSETGDHVTTTRICGSAITAIKFCLDGDMVAAASHNGSIYLYKVSRDGFSYKRHGKISGGQQLTHLDWDEDSEFLQTCSSEFNLNFWNVNTNKMEKVGSSMRDKAWVDQTCPVGWAVSGLWNNHNYNSNVSLTTVNASQSKEIVASGDAEGYIRLSRFPVVSPKAEFHEEKVVSGALAGVRFFYDESYVVAVGGSEGAIFKYRIK